MIPSAVGCVSRNRVVTASLVLAAVLSLAAASAITQTARAGSASDAPSVRLLAPERRVELRTDRNGRKVHLAGLAVYVASSGGDFRVDVTRPDYRDFDAAQVDAGTGAPLRSLPDGAVEGWRGIEQFLRVKIFDRDGTVIRRKGFRFCPNSYSRQRVHGDGPMDSRYPTGCNGRSPFQRGMVWGVDDGWATGAQLGTIRLTPGRYKASVHVPTRYRNLLEIPADDGRVEMRLRVRRGSDHGHGPEPVPIPLPEGIESRRSAEAPRSPLRAPSLDDPDPATMPDLAALPLWDVRMKSRPAADVLGFAASPWNAGPAPLVVEGYKRAGQDAMDAEQFFFDADGNAVGRAPTGQLALDRRRGHHHWHFEQFARFSLRDGEGGEVVRSRKQSFCIVPTDAIDLTVPRAEWNRSDRGSNCGGDGAIWLRQQLPAGWADTYYQSVAGQAFNVTNLPNGRYLLRLEVNPTGELFEVTDANNIADRVVFLRGKPGKRRVAVRAWNGVTR